MAQTTDITDDTKVGAVLSSPKNAGKLIKAGYETVGDLKTARMSEFMELGIGQVTLEEIQNVCGDPAPEEPEPEPVIEENTNPIHIMSPHPGFSLQIVPGDVDRGPHGRSMRPIQPVYCVCQDGRGKVTQKMWFMRLFGRENSIAIDEAVEKDTPWRVDCFNWLKGRKAFRDGDFRIMSD